MSVGQCIALLKAEVERKLASALIVFSAFRVSNPPTRPDRSKPDEFGPSGGHDLPKALPQLKSRERAAHTGNVSDHSFSQIRQNFSPQLKRIYVLTDSVVRVSRPQPASPVSVGDVQFAKIGATFPRVSETTWNL